MYRDGFLNSWFVLAKKWFFGQNRWPKFRENRTFALQNIEGSTMESNTYWWFLKYFSIQTSVSRRIFEFIICFGKKLFFGQNGWPKIRDSRTFALQNIEGSTMESNTSYWFLNYFSIQTSILRRIFEFMICFGIKMIFRSQWVTQNPGKLHLYTMKYRGLYDGVQHVLLISKVL